MIQQVTAPKSAPGGAPSGAGLGAPNRASRSELIRRAARQLASALWSPWVTPLIFAGVLTGLAVAADTLFTAEGAQRVWSPAAGIAVIAVLAIERWRLQMLAAVAVATAAAGWLDGAGPSLTAALVIATTAEAAAFAWVFGERRPGEDRSLLAGVPRLTMAAGLAASLGAGVLGLHARLTDGPVGEIVHAHGSSHFVAVLVFGPALFAVWQRNAVTRGRTLEWIVQLAFTITISGLLFAPWQGLPLSFLPALPLVWAGARLGMVPSVATLAISSGIAVVGQQGGGGPFASIAPEHAGALLQAMIVVDAIAVLSLGLLTLRRDELTATLRDSEEAYRRTFDSAMLGMAVLAAYPDGEQRIIRVNGSLRRILHFDPTGSDWVSLFSGADRREAATAVQDVARGALPGWSGELRCTRDGETRWLGISLAPLTGGPHGGPPRISAQLIDITERRIAEDRLRNLALHDDLTGLPNRTLLTDRLQLALAGSPRSGRSAAVLFIDLDDFKNVNDSAGHEAGDRLLIEVAERIGRAVRPTDTVARLGGDEFVVLCPDVPDADAAQTIADRILDALAPPVEIGHAAYSACGSIGMALSHIGSTPESLLREADTAMYAAKREGKRRVAIFAEEQRAHAVRTVRLEAELREALERGQFVLHYQPIVALSSGRVRAMEALVRWEHPQHGLLLPGEWLDVAETTQIMQPLGQWVLREAARQAAAWRHSLGPIAPRVHVNLSVRQLQAGGFGTELTELLAEHGLPPSALVLELSEGQLSRLAQPMLDDLAALRERGVHLAADDFGTGYSSLTNLTGLPLDIIKIDQKFVAALEVDPRARALVQGIVGIGQALGLQVIAEGVETRRQAEHLEQLGATDAQGFLWSPARPADVVAPMISAAASGAALLFPRAG